MRLEFYHFPINEAHNKGAYAIAVKGLDYTVGNYWPENGVYEVRSYVFLSGHGVPIEVEEKRVKSKYAAQFHIMRRAIKLITKHNLAP